MSENREDRRRYMAEAALSGMMGAPWAEDIDEKKTAEVVVRYADAVLAELDRTAAKRG